MIGLILVWLMFGIASSFVASNRGGSGVLWFIAGCVFGPLALLCAFFEGVECPFCRSKIHSKALICPKCQQNLVDLPPKEIKIIPLDEKFIRDPLPETTVRVQKTFRRLLWVFSVMVALTAIIAYNLNNVDSTSDTKTVQGSTSKDSSALLSRSDSSRLENSTNDWQSSSELYVEGRLINTYEVRYAVEEAIGTPNRQSKIQINNRDAWICTYLRGGNEIEITYLRDFEPPRNMWAYSIRQRHATPVIEPTSKSTTTPKPWRSVEALRVGNTIINEGELRIHVEALLAESKIGGDGKSLNDSTWICRYRNEGRDIEITYNWHSQSDYMSIKKIRFR